MIVGDTVTLNKNIESALNIMGELMETDHPMLVEVDFGKLTVHSDFTKSYNSKQMFSLSDRQTVKFYNDARDAFSLLIFHGVHGIAMDEETAVKLSEKERTINIGAAMVHLALVRNNYQYSPALNEYEVVADILATYFVHQVGRPFYNTLSDDMLYHSIDRLVKTGRYN